ncbi:MAG TPA: TMEM175 family protein [Anaerolineales bacterium]|nr:TMEM175 family protein [Anaerolineales bacterium]
MTDQVQQPSLTAAASAARLPEAVELAESEELLSHQMGLGRLVALIDGVFAVAMTLLVLDLKLPFDTSDLASALIHVLPGFLVYLIVFASIAGYWIIHHRTFCFVARVDARLTLLSLLNLLFITLFPLAASIVGSHPLEPLATICMSANSLLYCVSAWAIWSYAANHVSLLEHQKRTKRLRRQAAIMLGVGATLALAIPAAFVSVYLAYALWILGVPVASLVLRRAMLGM